MSKYKVYQNKIVVKNKKHVKIKCVKIKACTNQVWNQKCIILKSVSKSKVCQKQKCQNKKCVKIKSVSKSNVCQNPNCVKNKSVSKTSVSKSKVC